MLEHFALLMTDIIFLSNWREYHYNELLLIHFYELFQKNRFKLIMNE